MNKPAKPAKPDTDKRITVRLPKAAARKLSKLAEKVEGNESMAMRKLIDEKKV